MDISKAQISIACRQCKKDIKTETWRCVPCDKLFHPSCIKMHKVYNSSNELIPCKGKMEKIRREIRTWLEDELRKTIGDTVRNEMQEIVKKLSLTGTTESIVGGKKSYSEMVSGEQETVLIVKPRKEEDGPSDSTKRDLKKSINVSELGVGITKMKNINNGAVVIGYENKSQAIKLRDKVTKNLGNKYEIKAPVKKKWKLKIFGVESEDCENEQDFWKKVEEQNGIKKDSINGKILHKVRNTRNQRTTVIAEINEESHKRMQEAGKVKIGWNICRVQ